MKQVSPPDTQVGRRSRYQYDPSLHYVRVQKHSDAWDGNQLEQLLDEVDANGNDAYKQVLDGADSPAARAVTGHSQMVLLACSKEHIEAKIAAASVESQSKSRSVAPPTFEGGVETYDTMSQQGSIRVSTGLNPAAT